MPDGQKSTEVVAPRKTLSFAQAYELAVAMHSRGLLNRADQMYRTLLHAAPGHVDTLHRLGALSNQLGRPGEAVELRWRHRSARKRRSRLMKKRWRLNPTMSRHTTIWGRRFWGSDALPRR